MTLGPGSVLAHYRLLEKIGQGGMGVVWKATDSTLGRDVAVKVLPDAFALDSERLLRFEREARLLASLNHRHIASIYGLHTADGVRFLAMEYVAGDDLAARLARGPLPVPEALTVARQMAEGLESAHERGIIHRDLKPANVKLDAGGEVKILDFGLAKALEGSMSEPGPSLAESPTVTAAMTGANVLLGTAAYMSPEQARGREADRRADIWAFGVVLFEMLAGRQLFEGETVSDTLAAVLKTEPDWSRLPRETPPRVVALLRRCLERDARRRLRDIGEARIALEEVLSGTPDPAAAAAPAPPLRGPATLVLAGGGLVLGGLLALAAASLLRGAPPSPPVRKFQLALPAASTQPPRLQVISPDGTAVAYLIGDTLWVQELDELAPRRLHVEEGAQAVFWSADSRSVGLAAGGRLLRVDLGSAGARAICDTREPFIAGGDAVWTRAGSIVFSRADSAGMLEVAATGGDPRPLFRPDTTESDFHDPAELPGGRGLLFVVHHLVHGADAIWVWSGGRRRAVLRLADSWLSNPLYSPSGHLVFHRSGTNHGIWAVPFSLASLRATGEPFLVVPHGTNPSLAADGTLAYLGGGTGGAVQPVIADPATGAIVPAAQAGRMDRLLAMGPDGRLLQSMTGPDNEPDLWILDRVRGTRTRLTFETGVEAAADWSPVGDLVTYQASRAPSPSPFTWTVLVRRADGTGSADTIAAGVLPRFSPDGRRVFFSRPKTPAAWDLQYVDLAGGREPQTFLQSNSRLGEARLSPSGNLIAYMSNESGNWEVYLKRFPGGEGKWQVSATGGQWPQWNARGDRLYYAQASEIFEVEVSGGDTPVLGTPQRVLSRGPQPVLFAGLYANFAASGDGKHFAFTRDAASGERPAGVAVIQSWAAEFAKR